MRTDLGDGWSIDPRAGDGTLAADRIARRCATAADMLADLDRSVPAGAVGKLSEGGRDGIGVRAAWFYRDRLIGYHFRDGDCLEIVLTGADPAWRTAAWRSVRRTEPAADRFPQTDALGRVAADR